MSTAGPQAADVFVIFGITGDLAKVMTFHSLYRLERRGLLDCPIVGVAGDDWTVDQLRGEPCRKLSRAFDTVLDALSRLAQLVDGPVVPGHAHDRAVEQAAPLQPVERVKGHHLGQVAGDAEDDKHIGGLWTRGAHVLAFEWSGAVSACRSFRSTRAVLHPDRII